jgi:hypothetical protein
MPPVSRSHFAQLSTHLNRARDLVRVIRRQQVAIDKRLEKLEQQVRELKGLPLSDSKETT